MDKAMRDTNGFDEMRVQSTSGSARERLLELMLDAEKKRRELAFTIGRRETREGSIPLSYAPERLWFVNQMGQVGAAYNQLLALRLSGALVEAALERSFGELVSRHESL